MEVCSLSINSIFIISSRVGYQRNNCYASGYGSPIFMGTVPNKKFSKILSRVGHYFYSSNDLSSLPLRANGKLAHYKK